jgi:transposase InsO family protein
VLSGSLLAPVPSLHFDDVDYVYSGHAERRSAEGTVFVINGSGYVSRGFRDYLHLVGIKHTLAAPFRPQTNGKLERYHQTIKRDVKQVPYEMPPDLEAAIAAFVTSYNYRPYHKALSNVTPADMLNGRQERLLQRRKEVHVATIERRRRYNKTLRELRTCSS